MSHYIDVYTLVKEEKGLVRALERMGFKGKVEVHAKATNLVGYQGDKREQKAHVILRKRYVGSASNDIGFEKMEDGCYVSHISEYDQSTHYNKNWQNQLYTWYGVEVAKMSLDKVGMKYTEDLDEKERPRIRVKV